MRTKIAITLLLATTLLGGALATSTAQDPPSDGTKKAATDEKVLYKNPLESDEKLARAAKLGKILAKKRCVICHKIDGKGGVLSPPMEEVTANRFKKMAAYDQHIQLLKAKDPARYRASKKTLEEITAQPDPYKKLELWLKAYFAKPTFDNAQAKMTKQVLKPSEITQIIAYIYTLEPKAESKSD